MAGTMLAAVMAVIALPLAVMAYALFSVYGMLSVVGWAFALLTASALMVAWLAWAFRKEI